MKGAILSKVSAKLVKLGLVREIRAKAGMPLWRRDAAGQTYALKLTAAGLKAIAVDPGTDEAVEADKAPQGRSLPEAAKVPGPDAVRETRSDNAPRAGSKLAQVIDLLLRSNGAAILDLTEATGWLPHTTRAALTGLRKRGFAVVRERVGGGEQSTESRAPGLIAEITSQTASMRRTAAKLRPSQRGVARRNRHGSGASLAKAGRQAVGYASVNRFAAARRPGSVDRGGS